MPSVPPPVVHTEQPAFLRAGADDKKLSPVEAEMKSAHGSADDGAETEAERNMTVAEYAASQGVDEKKLMRKVVRVRVVQPGQGTAADVCDDTGHAPHSLALGAVPALLP